MTNLKRYERFQSQSFKILNTTSIAFLQVVSHHSQYVKTKQYERLNLPDLPTTTIGSFPQTREVRKYRADWKNHRITDAEYQDFTNEIARWIKYKKTSV